MLNWIYFILTAQFIWSVTSVIDKIVISKGYIKNPLVYIAVTSLTDVLLVVLLPFTGFAPLDFADFLTALLFGIFFGASVVVYYKAVQYEEISKIIIFAQLGPVLVFAGSYFFLGEHLSGNNLIGFLLFIIAGCILSYNGEEKSFKFGRAFFLMMVSMILSSFAILFEKHVFNITGFWSAFLWLRLASFASLSVLFLPSVRKEFFQNFKTIGYKAKKLIGFKMVIDFTALMLAGYAISKAPVSMVTALGNSVMPLFVFLIAVLISIYRPNILKEDISKKAVIAKMLAIFFVLAGIWIMN